MSESTHQDFSQDFARYKSAAGVNSDPGGALEGLWSEEHERLIREFEASHPGLSQEFDELLGQLPNPDDPEKTEFPFAASVVRYVNGAIEVLARSTNMVKARGDSTQHAEMVVLTQAQQHIGNRHLDGCLILSTAQPCEMCAGAMRNTNVGTLVYALSQQDLRGMHVQFRDGFKEVRTAPSILPINEALISAGVNVIAGYKHKEVLARLTRTVGTLKELYDDPDAKL
ncbi:MAG: nucleoside deaminase [Candidatus Roizmanbacteria bacterium]